jgi:hypothetical protein
LRHPTAVIVNAVLVLAQHLVAIVNTCFAGELQAELATLR